MADNKQDRRGNLKIVSAPPGYSEFKVIACDYSVTRPMDGGEPSGAPVIRNNCIKLTVETTKSVKYLRDWALGNEDKWGVISLVIAAGAHGTASRKLRYIYFGGRISKIEEDFSNRSGQMMATTLYIHPVAVTFAESNGVGPRLLITKGKVIEDAKVDLTASRMPPFLDGHDI
jgi:hypothetical protein